MPFQKVEFSFPDDEEQELAVEVEDSSAVEIDTSGKKTAEDYKEAEVEVEAEVNRAPDEGPFFIPVPVERISPQTSCGSDPETKR